MLTAYPISIDTSRVMDLVPKSRLRQKQLLRRTLYALFVLFMMRRYIRSGHLNRSKLPLSVQNHTYIKSDVDGCWLNFSSWPATTLSPPTGVVVLSHMYGSCSKNLDGLARFFNERNFDVYGLDYRGHGDSDRPYGLNDFGPNLDISASDLNSFLQFLTEKYQKRAQQSPSNHASQSSKLPFFLLGEGTGALITILALQKIHVAALYKAQGRLAFTHGSPPSHGSNILELSQRINGILLINPTLEFAPLLTVQNSFILRNMHLIASKIFPFLRTLSLPLWIKMFCGSFGKVDCNFFKQLSDLDPKALNIYGGNTFIRVMNLRTQHAIIDASRRVKQILENNRYNDNVSPSNQDAGLYTRGGIGGGDQQLLTLSNILQGSKSISSASNSTCVGNEGMMGMWNPYNYCSKSSYVDQYLENKTLPLLIMHATKDSLCTDEAIKKCFRLWKCPDKVFLHVSDVGHGFLHSTSQHVSCQATFAIREWLSLHAASISSNNTILNNNNNPPPAIPLPGDAIMPPLHKDVASDFPHLHHHHHHYNNDTKNAVVEATTAAEAAFFKKNGNTKLNGNLVNNNTAGLSRQHTAASGSSSSASSVTPNV